MTDTNQLPPLPTPKFTETIRGVPCITLTEHEHLMRAYDLQARAQVQGELSVDQMREMLSVHKLAIVPMRATHAMLDAMSDDDWQWSDLLAAAKAITEDEYDWIDATPQAEVTDSMIREAFLANGFTIKDGHSDLKPYVYAAARAILALHPVQVPMNIMDHFLETSAQEAAQDSLDSYIRSSIAAQAKKEQA